MDAAGRWTIVWIALLVVQGLLPLATVWLTRSLVDGLVAGVRAGCSWAALIITHRFTTAMSADAIHVMTRAASSNPAATPSCSRSVADTPPAGLHKGNFAPLF